MPHVLDRAKLESLGFRFARVVGGSGLGRAKRLLPRQVYSVFEYQGQAWSRLLKVRQAELSKALTSATSDSQRQYLRNNYERFAKYASRLILVDVGLDPAALRARYADRGTYLMTKAIVTAYTYSAGNKGGQAIAKISASVSALLPDKLYVPPEFRALIHKPGNNHPRYGGPYHRDRAEPPHYRITLAYGRRYEPWIEKVAFNPPAHPLPADERN